jgi:hypothetical protein
LRIAVVGALAATVLVGCGAAEAALARDTVVAADRQVTASTGAGGTSSAGTSEAPSADAITVSGSATGTITDVAVTCTTGGWYLQWRLKGSLNGSKVELATSITDDQGGQLTWYADGVGKAVSNANDTGKLVVGADQHSGSVDAQTDGDDNYSVHFSGPWQCS